MDRIRAKTGIEQLFYFMKGLLLLFSVFSAILYADKQYADTVKKQEGNRIP